METSAKRNIIEGVRVKETRTGRFRTQVEILLSLQDVTEWSLEENIVKYSCGVV